MLGQAPLIHITMEPGALRLPYGSDCVCVFHKDYQPPIFDPGALVLRWENFEKEPLSIVKGRRFLVVVGLSRIMTPANRVKLGQFLLRTIEGVQRITVDRTLFVSEPWRLFWHFSCVRVAYEDLTDSFLAETRYKQSEVGYREDPFTLDRIKNSTFLGMIKSYQKRYFLPLQVVVKKMDQDVHSEYYHEKAKAFEEENSSSAIITRLSKFAQSVLKERIIPSKNSLFNKTYHRIVVTDLGVDNWLVGELQKLVSLTNGIMETFYAD